MKRFVSTFAFVVVLALLTGQAALAAPPQQGGGIVHYVQAGENLDGIAAQYQVSAEAIMRQNGLVNPDMIYAGQVLVIPGGGYGPSPMYPGSGGYGCADYYTVQMGDTLSGIAWNFGISLEALQRQNNLYNANFVFIGQRLCIPAGGSYAPQPASYGNYGPVIAPEPWSYPVPPSRPQPPCGDNCGPAFHPQPAHPSPCDCGSPNCGGCPQPPHKPEPLPCDCGGPSCDGCPPPPCGCKGPDCKPAKPCFEIRHLTQEYEQWHRPANGLGACVNENGPYDVIRPPVTRFTVGVWLVNNSSKDLPGNWAYNPNVVFETKNGQWREACVWNPGTFNPVAKANGGKSVVVTFFTHLEQGDYIKDIHFLGLPGAPCFDPGNESVKPCNPVSPPAGTSPEMAFPSYPPGTTDVTPDTVFSSHS